jgi:hypothetical protein
MVGWEKRGLELVLALRNHSLRRGACVQHGDIDGANDEMSEMYRIVKELRAHSSVSLLADLLHDGEPWVRLDAAAALLRDGSSEAEQVLRVLARGTDDVRAKQEPI